MANRIILSGTLSSDPEMSYTNTGVPVTRFSLQTKRIDRMYGQEREVVSFISVLVWQHLAEDCNQYLRKDMEVYVTGELAIDSYKGRDRFKHIVVTVIASEVYLGDGTPLSADDDETGMAIQE